MRILQRLWLLFLSAAWLCLAASLPAGAQSLGNIQQGDDPLEINAEEGIEWWRDQKVYIARGNAHAASGDLNVYASVLTAHYREDAAGDSEIYLLEAEGDVRIETPDDIVYGEYGQYIMDEARFEMTGSNLKLVSKKQQDTVTARDSLEYWEEKQVAIARGNAQANHEDKQINADMLVAHFKPGADDKTEIRQVVGTGNVKVRTATEFASGNAGVYYVKEEIATLTCNVKVTQGENQMNGNYAVVNLKTGISKLKAAPPGSSCGNSPGRVDGLILPKSKPKKPSGQNQTE